MNSRKAFMIISLIAFMVSFGCVYANAIALPEGTDAISGVITEINSKDALIRVDGQPYYFKDISVMDTMLKTKNISTNLKVIVFYKRDGDKKLIVNIEINRQKDLN
ncbi:MAG: hypothetical protein Q8M56_14310 [Desulfobacterales bacterium]|nr:hypothetical protein [Desulfobacterales bacterium]